MYIATASEREEMKQRGNALFDAIPNDEKKTNLGKRIVICLRTHERRYYAGDVRVADLPVAFPSWTAIVRDTSAL